MDYKTINWTEIYKKYKGQWVALASDEETVVTASKDAKHAYEQARKKGLEAPITLNIPLELKSHIGGTL